MRIFVTGATGFIGKAVVQELIGAGHKVTGLARNDAAAKALAKAGAEAHKGSLRDLDSLRRGAAAADGVIHLAFMHGPSKASFPDLMRIFLGGLPGGIVSRFGSVMTEADQGAIDAIGETLAGSGKPFVATFGTIGAPGSRILTEDIEPDPKSAMTYMRARAEAKVRAFASRGVRATLIRLPPSVHGAGDAGFMPQIIGFARKNKASAYIGDGANRWPSVHRLDAAKLYRLALETGEAGARYHAVADEGIAFRDIADVIGRRLGLPVVSKSGAEAARHFGFISPFVALDNPASSAITRAKLGWAPMQTGLIADLDSASYFGG